MSNVGTQKIFDKARWHQLEPRLVALRRELHSWPELGYQEFRTAQRVAQWLAELPGVKVRSGVAGTGVVATIGAERSGACVALRADMDGLPMRDGCGKPYASRNPGVAHTCGHDGHTACLLGAATMITAAQECLVGPVKLLFQPAEEGGGGADAMIAAGALEAPEPSAIFALHAWPGLEVGRIGLRSGAVMAATDAIDIKVVGRGTHASTPHCGVDPIVAAAQVVTALQSVVARRKNPVEPAVVTIGAISGGTARNIIPDEVVMQGTLRTLSPQSRAELRGAIKQVAEASAAASGAHVEVVLEAGYPVCVNDPHLMERVKQVLVERFGSECVIDNLAVSLGGEDFAYYAQRVPGCFVRLGMVGADGAHGGETLHNAAFDFNDAALATGVEFFCTVAQINFF